MFTLSDAILNQDMMAIEQLVHRGEIINRIDEYGFTPLIEAAIIDNIKIADFLIKQGADVNQPDVTGGTALHWAAENNNIALCQLLFLHGANPNAYTLAGQPALTMPMLRQQEKLKKVFLEAGASLSFVQDYINTKLLGHIYELLGSSAIVAPTKESVEVDFEGFYLEVTLGLIADALNHFQNHFAARQLRRYQNISKFIVEVLNRAAALIKFQQYRVKVEKHQETIFSLLQNEPVIIPVGYEGHAITFIKYGDIWVKCDRREDSRLYDNVMFYRIQNIGNATPQFLQTLIYVKQTDEFINHELDQILALEPLTELQVEAQISGNCTWANVEACIPALFFLVMLKHGDQREPLSYYKTLSLNYFHIWRAWNKDRMLDYALQAFREGNTLQKMAKAETLAAILFQRCDYREKAEKVRFERILAALVPSPYEYLLENYLKVYYYTSYTEEGKRFFDYLKQYKLFNL